MFKLLPLTLVLLAASTTVFAQTYTVIHNFGNGSGDPANPSAAAISQGRGGDMLSTATDDATDKVGKAFRIWTGGTVQVLHQFGVNSRPEGGLVLGTDGKFYGTTYQGGSLKLGSIFKLSSNGTVTTLHNFTGGNDGAYPAGSPIQSAGGDFFGTTVGAYTGSDSGSVYRITKDGNFTVLHTFNGSDGAGPMGQLVQGTDFYFYGATREGGSSNNGTIFRISSSGDFKVLVNFNGANGSDPRGGLIQANDGNFYGTTYSGGTAQWGVLFRMTPAGTLTVLHNFTGGSDGAQPAAGLVQASDGNLYGTDTTKAADGLGVLFRATLAGGVLPLHNFFSPSGGDAFSGLLQHTNGKIYGETFAGGKFGGGVFYSEDAGLPPFVTYLPVYGRSGAMVEILGQGFTSSSKVYFNGTQATNVMEVYPAYIRAEVPQGATTGPITVTTSSGTLKSNKVFVVH
jgi:uncharacterized repeat protein (TIGR03803 family)